MYIYTWKKNHNLKWTKVFTSVWADSLQSLVGFLLLEFKWWKDKPGKNIPRKLREQKWEHIQPLKSCFCITPAVLEMALGVCKLSLKIQTITLISFQQGGHEAKSRPAGQCGRGNVSTSHVVWLFHDQQHLTPPKIPCSASPNTACRPRKDCLKEFKLNASRIHALRNG